MKKLRRGASLNFKYLQKFYISDIFLRNILQNFYASNRQGIKRSVIMWATYLYASFFENILFCMSCQKFFGYKHMLNHGLFFLHGISKIFGKFKINSIRIKAWAIADQKIADRDRRSFSRDQIAIGDRHLAKRSNQWSGSQKTRSF